MTTVCTAATKRKKLQCSSCPLDLIGKEQARCAFPLCRGVMCRKCFDESDGNLCAIGDHTYAYTGPQRHLYGSHRSSTSSSSDESSSHTQTVMQEYARRQHAPSAIRTK